MATLSSKLILSLVDQVTGPARGVRAALAGINGQVGRFNRGQMAGAAALGGGFASRLLAIGAGYVGVSQGIRGTVGQALSFESALADVRKVVDASDEQFGNMRQSIIDLSKQLPVAADGIAAIYAAAAQSGVANEELKGFADGVVKVSTAWDTSVETTGEALAKIKTALHRNLKDTFSLADAINEVSNVSAASAPDMLEFTNRVAAFAETAGFAAEDALAFGAAMVGSGFEPEVAATSFRNLTRALTKGSQATKAQRVAFKALGLDATKTAKNMQKNAVETTLDVLDRIKKLPEFQQISIASALFGDEARALAPLFANADELRRLLRLTGDAANYSGSAFKEYVARADTVSNVLQILRNKVADVFRGVGDKMLPDLKEAALGIGGVLDTLGERASVFDKLQAAASGFLQGLGFKGGVRESVEALGDLLFGKADGSGAADQLGRLFEQFRQGGAAIKEFWEANKDSPIAKFLGEISGYGFGLAVASVGIGMLASAVSGLARALFWLTGAKAAVGILKMVASSGKWLFGLGGAGAVAGGAATGATATGVAGGGLAARLGKLMTGLKLGGLLASFGSLVQGLGDTPGDSFAEQVENQRKARESLQGLNWRKFFFGAAADPGFSLRDHMSMNTGVGKGDDVSAALRDTIIQTKPTGTQDVKVTNPIRPNVNVSVTVHNTEGDPAAIGAAVGSAVKSQVEGLFTDGGM